MGISWWAFIGVVAVAYAIPGPDFAVILRSATRGLRAGVAAAVGAQTGLLVHMLLAVAGLSVVLARFPDVLTAIRVLGGAYLLYLGGRLVLPPLGRHGHGAASEQSPAGDLSGRSAFIHGLLTNLLNPKAVLFFAAVLPQFVAPDATAPVWAQIAALGVVDVLLGFAAWALVVAAGACGRGGTGRRAPHSADSAADSSPPADPATRRLSRRSATAPRRPWSPRPARQARAVSATYA